MGKNELLNFIKKAEILEDKQLRRYKQEKKFLKNQIERKKKVRKLKQKVFIIK